MSGIRHRSQRSQVINPVQAGFMGDGIDAPQEKVDQIRFAGP